MKKKIFYRVGNTDTGQGLWYSIDGEFTGLIHDKFDFCMNKDLPMPYDPEIIGWQSTTDKFDDLFFWFALEDISRLEEFGYRIAVYEATEYKFYKNHWVMKQDTSILKRFVLVSEIEEFKKTL